MSGSKTGATRLVHRAALAVAISSLFAFTLASCATSGESAVGSDGSDGASDPAEREEDVDDLDNSVPPRANLQDGTPWDHWHAAFAIDVCGTELEPLEDGAVDPLGIHTHGDGLVHIHPFSRLASGERATLDRYFEQVGLTVTDDGLKLPEGVTHQGGDTFREGSTTCGGEEAELVLAVWDDATAVPLGDPDRVVTESIGDVRFTVDLAAFSLAFVPVGAGDAVAPPSSAAEIESLGAADGGS